MSETSGLDTWIAALRSGEYRQTDGVLARELASEIDEEPVMGYCCLGVAEVCLLDEKFTLPRVDGLTKLDAWGNSSLPYGEAAQKLSAACGLHVDQLRKDYEQSDVDGIELFDPYLWDEQSMLISCSQLNDSRKASFETIAELLEANKPWLQELKVPEGVKDYDARRTMLDNDLEELADLLYPADDLN